MTSEAQRIAIAEECGWTPYNMENSQIRYWRPPQGEQWSHQVHQLPDYLNDLNAMHEAERSIGLHGDNFRGRMLRRSWGAYTAFLDSRFLTASERAQAILMTIKKWTNDH